MKSLSIANILNSCFSILSSFERTRGTTIHDKFPIRRFNSINHFCCDFIACFRKLKIGFRDCNRLVKKTVPFLRRWALARGPYNNQENIPSFSSRPLFFRHDTVEYIFHDILHTTNMSENIVMLIIYR